MPFLPPNQQRQSTEGKQADYCAVYRVNCTMLHFNSSLYACHRHIDGSHMVVGRSLSPIRRRATHCRSVYATLPTVRLFLAVFSKHISSQSTNVRGALEALARMRYFKCDAIVST